MKRHPRLGDRQFSVIASLIPVAANLALTPVLTRTLGTTEYGLWATLIAVLASVQLADFGVGSSLLRFMTVTQSREGRLGVSKYLVSASLYFVILASVILVIVLPWRDALFDFVNARTTSPELTIVMFFCVVALVPVSTASVVALQSVGDFKHAAGVIFCGQVVYALVVITGAVLLELTVAQVFIAQASQAVLVLSYVAIHLRTYRSARLLTRGEIREFGLFSSRVWLTNLSSVVVLQLPVIIVASMVSTTLAGVYGLAAMVAVSLRTLPLMSVAPLIRGLTGSRDEIVSRSIDVDRTWRKMILAYAGIGALGIILGLPILGGAEYTGAIAPSILLFAGYVVQLWGALATITARQLGLTAVEWRASALGAGIHLALLWPAITLLGIFGPGAVLLTSQFVTLVIVRRQFKSFAHGKSALSID